MYLYYCLWFGRRVQSKTQKNIVSSVATRCFLAQKRDKGTGLNPKYTLRGEWTRTMWFESSDIYLNPADLQIPHSLFNVCQKFADTVHLIQHVTEDLKSSSLRFCCPVTGKHRNEPREVIHSFYLLTVAWSRSNLWNLKVADFVMVKMLFIICHSQVIAIMPWRYSCASNNSMHLSI